MVADTDDPTVLSVHEYESGPPVVIPSPDGQLVSSDGDTLATSKQEEWITKRKTELVTTKQIETRVKRQVVLEDGKVIEDSGPLVTTTTTEDTDKNESEHTEHKSHGDDQPLGEGWVPIQSVPDDAVVKETNEKKIVTHDEVEDITETEEIQHYGNMTNRNIARNLRDRDEIDSRRALLTKDKNELLIPLSPYDKESSQKRIVNQSRRHDRTTDIEDTKEVSKLNDVGNLVTEITRRHEHEEFHNEDIPDSDSDEFDHIENRVGSREYNHSKNEDYVDYIAVPKGGNLSSGRKVGEGTRIVSENINSHREGDEDLWDSVSERIRKSQKEQSPPINQNVNKLPNQLLSPGRSDALTSRPLDFDQEEHTRKNETNRWLNSHFGSSSSSLNSETSSPHTRSPPHAQPPTPQGIHVTMTSRSSPLHSPPPPPPMPATIPMPPNGVQQQSQQQHKQQQFASSKGVNLTSNASKNLYNRNYHEPVGKRISFGDTPSPRPSPLQKDVHFDLRNRHEDVMRSLNSQFGRSSLTKSGTQWDEEPTPTPPPRTRRRNSPDIRNVRTPDHTANVHQLNTMNYYSRKNTSSPLQEVPSYLQKTGDTGERKAFERREQSFGYSGPGQRPLSRDALDSGDSGYVTKHNNYYKTEENNNPSQTIHYKNGDAEISERKTVERREKVFTYDGASQKQFHPKYILGSTSSTMGRLRGVEGSGAILEEDDNLVRPSQTLPRRKFYFGDEEGSLLSKHAALESRRSIGNKSDKEHRFGVDDINVSISNKYNQANNVTNSGKTSGLSRSMSFTPRSLSREKAPVFVHSSTMAQIPKSSYVYKSNPHLVDSPDLLSPRLISLMSRSVRDVNSLNNYNNNNYQNDQQNVYSNRRDTTNVSRSKRTFLENVKKNSPDLYEPILNRTKASSPARSMTPTNYSPTIRNDKMVATRSLNSPRPFEGTNSPLSDDYQETYRMTNSTPDSDVTKPKISTDTTSRFSRKTIRGIDGQPAGKVESSETTTRTKSRFKESEIMFPKGHREGSPASFRSDFRPQMTTGGSVIIPVKDTNNNKNVHYAN